MTDDVASSLVTALEVGSRLEKIRAALTCMDLAYIGGGAEQNTSSKEVLQARFQTLPSCLTKILDPSDSPSALAASWAFAWLGEHRMLTNLPEATTLLAIFRLWRELPSPEQARFAAWALASQPLLARGTFSKDAWGDCDAFLLKAVTNEDYRWRRIQHCALVVGWYRRSPWSDAELIDQLNKCIEIRSSEIDPTVRELLENLGGKALDLISVWENKQTSLVTKRGVKKRPKR